MIRRRKVLTAFFSFFLLFAVSMAGERYMTNPNIPKHREAKCIVNQFYTNLIEGNKPVFLRHRLKEEMITDYYIYSIQEKNQNRTKARVFITAVNNASSKKTLHSDIVILTRNDDNWKVTAYKRKK
ncbi:hypothetical protein M6D81_03375 [Paenibacillus sp. J5C_2022]|uniref:hypothetical protein n=1 Tax=Paenibacillus sp. J5C2022 TaxID=2977129 RepID=UPI0021D3E7C2|nr:hypothetical protein [Paenibacillus sp. J5C2022]MCU6707741.1 hypothetical protein [Paenibacillus sp. J5C2022]